MVKTIDNIPVYKAKIYNYDEGMFCISLVDDPAVEVNFLAFDKEEKKQTFAILSEEKKRVIGCVARADYPIYRIDSDGYEYYLVFEKDTIRKMAQKYFRDYCQNNTSVMHDGSLVDGIELVQFFIKDSEKGITPQGFEHVSDGSLFAEYQVTNEDLWNSIKEGVFKGFSLEGFFSHEIVKLNKSTKMTKIEKLKQVLAGFLAGEKFFNVATDKAVIHWDGEEDLKEGMEVYTLDEEGNRVALEDGDYTTEDGKVIRVEGGKVASITDPQAEVDEGEEQAPEENPDERPGQGEEIARLNERIDALEGRIEELTDIIEGLVNRLQKMSAEPAKKEFKKDAKSADVKGFESLMAMASGLKK